MKKQKKHLPEIKDSVFKAVAASRRMGNYIQSVRKQIGTTDSEDIFSLEQEIKDAVDIVQFKAREASVQIVVETENITLHGNALRFYQIVLNLIMNAIEACEHTDDTNTVHISLHKDGSNAVLSVKDTGCGMDEETIAHVYKEFFTTKPYNKGTGFGLSQTREFVEKEFNGTIRITSQVNHGTEFIITIPLIANEEHTDNSYSRA